MENSMEDPKKIKNRTIISSSNSASGSISKGKKALTWKIHLYSHVHSGIIYNGQNMETTCFYQ